MPQFTHLQDYAHEMIARHGPRTPGMVWAQFANQMGNYVAGESAQDQIETVAKEMLADPRLVVVKDNPGRGGDWFAHVPDGED